MRIEIQWNSLFPLSMPYVTTLQYQEIFWQNGSLLYGSDTAKQEFFMRLQLCLQSLHKHDFISNQLLFYCWLTQQHFNFSVSFSFKNSVLRICIDIYNQAHIARGVTHPKCPPKKMKKIGKGIGKEIKLPYFLSIIRPPPWLSYFSMFLVCCLVLLDRKSLWNEILVHLRPISGNNRGY